MTLIIPTGRPRRTFPESVLANARNVDLVHLAGTLGLNVNTRSQGGPRCQCPNHTSHANGDATPSVHVYRNGEKTAWPHLHCFACNWRGDAIRLVQDALGVDFVQAVRHLTGEAEQPIPVRAVTPVSSLPAQPIRNWARLADDAAGRLWTHDAAAEYVIGRGLAPVAERYRLGYVPPFTKKTGEPSPYGDRLTIPHYRADGTVPYIKYRLLEERPGEPKYMNTAGALTAPYLWDEALPAALERGHLMVCEGEIDALSVKAALHEVGDDTFPVIGLPGAGSLKRELDAEFAGLRVILVMDSDRAGDEARRAYHERLGGLCELVDYPALDGDMNDTLRMLGHAGCAEFVQSMLDWHPPRRRVL